MCSVFRRVIKDAHEGARSHILAGPMKKLKTPKEVRADFEFRGESIAAWARKHGLGRSLVYEVLSGRKKCLRGDGHRAAVLLGIKRGVIPPSTKIGAA